MFVVWDWLCACGKKQKYDLNLLFHPFMILAGFTNYQVRLDKVACFPLAVAEMLVAVFCLTATSVKVQFCINLPGTWFSQQAGHYSEVYLGGVEGPNSWQEGWIELRYVKL